MAGGWNVVSTAPDTQAQAPAPKSQWSVVSHQPEGVEGVGDAVKGALQLVGAGVLNIPHAAAAGAQDLYNKWTGNTGTNHWAEFPIEPGSPGSRLATTLSQPGPISPDEQIRNERRAQLQHDIQGTVAGDIAQNAGEVGEDVANLLPAGEALNTGRKIITSGIKGGLEAAGAGTDWKAAGFRNGGGHPISRNVAGESGQDALTIHNQDVGNAVNGAEAGVPHGTQLGYDALADARAEPNAVWNRTANALPTQELPQETVSAINDAAKLEKVSTLTEADQQRVARMAQNATTGPRSGQQVIEDMRTLRQEGFKRAASEDVDQQNIGKAQLDMARALEAYVGKAIPANADVSLEQFQAARQALAKNWTVQEALRGSDVDLQALARMQRADPELLTGGLKVSADFANGAGREVTSLANRYNPPSLLRDAKELIRSPVGAGGVGAAIATGHAAPASLAVGAGLLSRGTARRFLTGDTGAAIDRAQAMFPGREPGQFGPLNSAQLPGGRLVRPGETGEVGAEGTGVGANPNPSPATPASDLAGILSQDLERQPAGGPSMSFHGGPQQGLPFRFSPEVVGERPVQGGSPQLAETTDDYGNRLSLEKSNSPGAQFEIQPEPQRPPLADRLAGPAEAAPTNRGTVERFGPVNAQTGSEGRVVSTPMGKPQLGDILSELRAMVGQGVPEGTAVKAGPRTGPSRPWLEDENRPNPRENDISGLLEDLFGPESKVSNNASGQTDVSQEFANWQEERRAAGITRHRYDPATDEMVPMHSTSARDPTSVKGRPVFDRGPDGKYTVVDRGGLSPEALNGIINRVTQLGTHF